VTLARMSPPKTALTATDERRSEGAGEGAAASASCRWLSLSRIVARPRSQSGARRPPGLLNHAAGRLSNGSGRTADAPLADRARAYLHSNCSNCHRAGAQGRGDIDLRFSATWSQLNACDVKPRTGNIRDTGNRGAQRIIAPGRKQDSVLWMRMGLEGHFQMPPLGIKTADPFGVMLIGEWIDSLDGCEP